MAGSLTRPGVEVTQEFVTNTPSVITPKLNSALIGACFQIVDAFDDNGNPQSTALAGTYTDGVGTVAYDLPNLQDEASITGFENDVRVFLLLGADSTELNGSSDEESIATGTTGVYTEGTLRFSDSSATFNQLGVLAGDVVRLTYQTEVFDLVIASVDSDTQVTVEANGVNDDLTAVSYSIIRNPAEFIVSTGTQGNVILGPDESNYISWTTLAASDTYAGSNADTLNLEINGGDEWLTATDGAAGDCIFTSAGASFFTSVGARGPVTNEILYVGTGADDGGVFRDITHVVSDTQIHIETGEGLGVSGATYHVGDDGGATYDANSGTTDATVGTGCVLTVTGGNFTTSVGAVGPAPANTFVETSDGVYVVEAVNSDNSIDIFSTATGAGSSNLNPVILKGQATTNDGATPAALTAFASISADFSTLATLIAPAAVTTTAVTLTASADGGDIASVTDADNVVLGSALAASGNTLGFKVVTHTTTLNLAYDPGSDTIQIRLVRDADGVLTSTYAQVQTAVTSAVDPAYNAIVASHITSAVTGTGTFLEADVATYDFDGGSDDDQILLDADLIGSTTPTANVYVTYKALRVDVSAGASNPSLLSYNSSTTAENAIGPFTTDNPLGLGFYFALLNSGGRDVKGIGVSAVSTSKPFGTVAAFSEAYSFLESQDVYTLVPLTQDAPVHQAGQTHVNAMSQPTEKAERVIFINNAFPDYAQATTVTSGTSGNTGTVDGVATAEFATSVNLSAAGVVAGDILVVSSLSGSTDAPDVVNGTLGPLYGVEITGLKSGDNFVAEFDGTDTVITSSWDDLVDVSWTIYRAGAAITSAADQSERIALIGESYNDRRVFHHYPAEVTADVDGTSSNIEGFYLAAGWAGKAALEPPERGFTEGTVAGYSAPIKSNGYFSNSQLDRMAGGGTWTTIQESTSGPLKCRHQLATDVSTIQRREYSITRTIDYTAKFLRSALTKNIGRFNITQSFIDSLATSVQGLGRFLVESGKLTEFQLSSIQQSDTAADTIEIVVVIGVPFPVNYIAITLEI
jgi:hypothetical protein